MKLLAAEQNLVDGFQDMYGEQMSYVPRFTLSLFSPEQENIHWFDIARLPKMMIKQLVKA